MEKIIKKIGLLIGITMIAISGTFGYWRMVVFPKENLVPIFCYHKISLDQEAMSVSPERFREQLDMLRAMGYYSISLKELGDLWEQGKNPEPGAIAITFDDGYQNNYSIARPILNEKGFSATVFVIVDRKFQDDLLQWDEIAALRKSGWEIGSHTWSHVDLAIRPDYHGEVEIKKSRLTIAKKSDGNVNWLAYPYGSWSERTAWWAKESGYQGAVTTRSGLASKKDGMYSLDRISMTPGVLPAPLDLRLRLLKAEVVEFLRWISWS